jgi:dihydroorotate dehydrogenase (fumarate)
MLDLSVKYLGLPLRNPVVVGSCGLTSTIESLKQLEAAGAGAVVLRSIFEEEILRETETSLSEAAGDKLIYSQLSETLDYLDLKVKEERLGDYLALIRKAKSSLLIPVIASVNCVTAQEWTSFAKRIEDAGADAIELNVFINPLASGHAQPAEIYCNIAAAVKQCVSIPVSLKLSSHISSLPEAAAKISAAGADGLVLFNRFYSPDIDLQNMKVICGHKYSQPAEYSAPLRWIGLVSAGLDCSIAASTGIHSGETAVKMLLAGADCVQVVSAVYKSGPSAISAIIAGIEKWMVANGYNYIDQYRGLLASGSGDADSCLSFERVQFMKYFGGI